MFDFGFSELILVVLVALVVLSPKDFGRISRTLGEWVSKGRRYWRELSDQLKQEHALRDVKSFRDDIAQQARDVSQLINEDQQSVVREIAPELNLDDVYPEVGECFDSEEPIKKNILTRQALEQARVLDPFANPYNLPPTYEELVEQVRCLHQRVIGLETPKIDTAASPHAVVSCPDLTEVKHVES